MSNPALDWAWNQQAPTSTAKLVLVALADHADASGSCHPSMKRIAEKAQCSTRQVSRCVESLEGAGLVERVSRRRMGEGKYGAWVYRLRMKPSDTSDQTTRTSSGHLRPVDTDDQRTPEAPTSGHSRPEPADMGVRSEPSEEPSSEPPTITPVDFEADFWQPYPKRDGKKLGKKQAEEQWKKLTEPDRTKVATAVVHYRRAADDPKVFCPIKDPWRWLRDRWFDDWQEPAQPHARDGPDIGSEWDGMESGRLDLGSVR